ncbi:MAG: hypothetical protein C4K49_03065 [Candidatus Thorarchaeota archaeon]|nr:MAG: hypothetical protein C4K49_03065 [Candidatus Thorarchaeota archaeon]
MADYHEPTSNEKLAHDICDGNPRFQVGRHGSCVKEIPHSRSLITPPSFLNTQQTDLRAKGR